MNNFIVDKLRTHTRTATPALIKVEERWQNQQTFIHAIFFQNHMQFFEKRHSLFHQLSKQNPKRPFSLATPKLHVDLDQTGNHIQTTRESTKGRYLASIPVRRILEPFFIRVHFVLRPVRWYKTDRPDLLLIP